MSVSFQIFMFAFIAGFALLVNLVREETIMKWLVILAVVGMVLTFLFGGSFPESYPY